MDRRREGREERKGREERGVGMRGRGGEGGRDERKGREESGVGMRGRVGRRRVGGGEGG